MQKLLDYLPKGQEQLYWCTGATIPNGAAALGYDSGECFTKATNGNCTSLVGQLMIVIVPTSAMQELLV